MINVLIGDSRNLIKDVEDQTFDCVMTSPPYWGLRDYGHDDQIGLESTPEKYLETMWSLFDNIKLKLKDEGNCFVNLGDTYWGGGNASGHTDDTVQFGSVHTLGKSYVTKPVAKGRDFKAKCLCMIPQRFAWGMIERGWILRNEIIWHKPNHMPESVTDRLTKSHEVIWHFVKQQKYYYDLDAIREPHKWVDSKGKRLGSDTVGAISKIEQFGYNGKFDGRRDVESFGSPRARTQRKNDNTGYGTDGKGIQNHSGNSLNHPCGKNPGDVWQINTQPCPEAHFAVFPIKLVRRPILAGCPPGGHVLDPFGGSGTVAEFCRKNERDCTIFELNPQYESLIKERAMLMYPTLGTFDSEGITDAYV